MKRDVMDGDRWRESRVSAILFEPIVVQGSVASVKTATDASAVSSMVTIRPLDKSSIVARAI
jgi:hypothetical protein